jgi:hypothetical protein
LERCGIPTEKEEMMREVRHGRTEVVETLAGAAGLDAEACPAPGTWEADVWTFAGAEAREATARHGARAETRHPTGRRPDRDRTRDPVSELLTVASAVETFLEGYLKANPGHALATVLCQALRSRLRAVAGKAG